jgi:hypothetical protein
VVGLVVVDWTSDFLLSVIIGAFIMKGYVFIDDLSTYFLITSLFVSILVVNSEFLVQILFCKVHYFLHFVQTLFPEIKVYV